MSIHAVLRYKQVQRPTSIGLRLYPPIPINVRFANKDTTLPKGGGPHGENPIFVKKGTPVAFSPYGMHRRSEFFGSEPCKFIPERWDALRVRWEFVPFSGGARVCLGSKLSRKFSGTLQPTKLVCICPVNTFANHPQGTLP